MNSIIEKHRILVVDGSDNILELVRKILEGEGYEVVTRNSFAKGLEHIKSNPQISLVLSDHCEKKGRNGLHFLDQVSTHSPKTIKVLTTCCLQSTEFKCPMKAGTVLLRIEKPFQINEILDIVKLGLKQYGENI
jgi:DNA-binding NtrC family response regulator